MLIEVLTAALVIGVSATLVFFGLTLSAWRSLRRDELERRLGPGGVATRVALAREADAVADLLGPVGGWLADLQRRAGWRQGVSGTVLATLALAGAGALSGLRLGWGVGLALAVVAGALPTLWVARQAAARSRQAAAQLPDALDLMARAMRAGHAFSDALRLAADDTPAPLGEELSEIAEEHRLGLDLRTSLHGLVARLPESFEVRLLVAAILLNRETGGNLIEILEHIGETVRERMVFDARVQALTAEVRMSATILAILPFGAAALLMVTEPSYLVPLTQPGWGLRMLSGGLVMMSLGLFVMNRLSRVEL